MMGAASRNTELQASDVEGDYDAVLLAEVKGGVAPGTLVDAGAARDAEINVFGQLTADTLHLELCSRRITDRQAGRGDNT